MAKLQCNMISYVLGRAVDITLVIPSTTMPESFSEGEEKRHILPEPYPVLYLLHGMGNNHATWCGYAGVEFYAEEHNIAVVMISGENKCYRNVPGGDNYFDFISQELPEFVTNYFPLSKDSAHTYIAGLSMGGYGALLHGMSDPERFAAIGSFSGAVDASLNMSDEELTAHPELDIYYLTDRALAAGKKIPPMYLACGEDDFLYEMSGKYKDYLLRKHVDVTWESVPGYTHEWRFWNMQIEQFLKWLPRTDGYAEKGVRKV